MPNILNAQGLTVESLSEILDDLTAGYTTIYGPSINLDSNTPDGQMMNIYATALEDNLELLESVYAQFSLTNAFGVQVDNLVATNGIQRQAASNTTTYVNVTVTAALTLPGQDILTANPNGTVFTVSDSAGNQYQLVTSYVFGAAGTATLEFIAVNTGQVLVSSNTITVIVTPLSGVSSVNNPNTSITTIGTIAVASAHITAITSTTNMFPGMLVVGSGIPSNSTIVSVDSATQVTISANATANTSGESITVSTIATVTGTNEESDVQLKIRQAQSFALAATGPADTLRAQLLNTPGIIDAFVPENDTTSPVSGVPATGIWVIVNATTATPQQIAQVIYSKKTAGCAQKLTVGHSYTLNRPAGNTFTAYWDYAIPENLYIAFQINPINGSDTFNTSVVATQLAAALSYKLNQSAFVGQIISAMNTLYPNAYLTTVVVDTSGPPAQQEVSPSDYAHFFVLLAANISVTT